MAYKRKRSSSVTPYSRPAKRRMFKTARRMQISSRPNRLVYRRMSSRVNKLWKTIETKEGCYRSAKQDLLHNAVTIVYDNTAGSNLNPFRRSNATGDPMDAAPMQQIGDQITLKGMKICCMVENQLQRAKVYYRFMLLRCPRGVTPTRTDLFKGCSPNKMLDQVNTEKFSIIWQKVFNCTSSNNVASALNIVNGVPSSGTPAGIPTKVFNAWIPGSKFGRNGTVQYESGNGSEVKFYDYRFAVVAYDWFGTPQDANAVGLINDFYCKTYFKDA